MLVKKFLPLKQEAMSASEYRDRFLMLSRYATVLPLEQPTEKQSVSTAEQLGALTFCPSNQSGQPRSALGQAVALPSRPWPPSARPQLVPSWPSLPNSPMHVLIARAFAPHAIAQASRPRALSFARAVFTCRARCHASFAHTVRDTKPFTYNHYFLMINL